MVQRDARIDGEAVEMLQFINAAQDMVFDGFGQCHVMCGQYQFHGYSLRRVGNKIQ
jgi:hypothetical protein